MGIWPKLVLPGPYGERHYTGKKMLVYVFLLQEQADLEALVGISCCMVVMACPRRGEALYDGVLRWFRGPAHVR